MATPFSLTCLIENNYIPFGAQFHFVIVPGCCAVFLFYSQFLTLFLYLLLYLAIYFVTLDFRRNSRIPLALHGNQFSDQRGTRE